MTRRTDPASVALVAAAVTMVLWASSFVVIRSAGEHFSPGGMAFLRLAVGTAVLVGLALRHRRPFPRGRSLALVLAYGVLWFGAYTVLLNWAERHLDAGTASLLVNFAPILVAVTAGLFFGEGFPTPLVIGMAIAFTGVVIIAVGGSGGSSDMLGIGLGLLTAVLYATGVLTQKAALRSVDSVTATWVGCAAGMLATVPFASSSIHEIAHAPTSAVVGVIYLGIGPTAIAFTTWAYALSRTDAGRLAATSLVVPALAIGLSWLTLGEVPTVFGFVGGALCLTGVAISRRRSRVVDAAVLETAPVVRAAD
ncbi:DMT family transporter [Williamsia sp. SKLECPSW1]